MLARIIAVLALGFALLPLPASAQKFEAGSVYICPNHSDSGLECYLDAVVHLYTMCRHVKSIEIIEFGYEKSTEGTNGAKSEYCIDKHRLSMARPYQAALKEATPSAKAINGLRELQELWLKSLNDLKWIPGETDEQYKARVAKPYEIFSERAIAVRGVLPEKGKVAAPPADKDKKGKPAKPPPKTKSAT